MSVEKLHSSEPWHRLRQDFLAAGEAGAVLKGLSGLVDRMVIGAYKESVAPVFPSGLALLAVGGFGRGELFPYSDVDLLLLVGKEPTTQPMRDALAYFIRGLWDVDLRLSHSVRTVPECAELHEENVELNISLLDRRFLCGDEELNARLSARLPIFYERQGPALMRNLARLTRARHSKYQDTIYHLEPDAKETPGGLRDLHVVSWLGQLSKDLGNSREALASVRSFLYTLRCFLHYEAGRDRNLLSHDMQEKIAEQPFSAGKEPQLWMRDYYRNARQIHAEARRALEISERKETSMLTQFRDWRARLSNADFTVSRERVYLRAPQQLDRDPMLVYRLLEFTARHGIPLAVETERRLAGHTPVRPPWPALRAILVLPHAAVALRAMLQTGLMRAVFPEWERIECLVVRDFYHRYTVDEHTLVTVEALAGLRDSQDPLRQRFSELLGEVEDAAPLIFALLFHDTGKGSPGEGHSAESARLALEAMARIQAPAEEQQTVSFLIERHLDLSAVMGSRDLDDPATARMLAARVGTIERLRLLTLLTYADVSAVNPTAMSPWRLEQLWRIYRVTQHELTRELETERIHEVPPELPAQAAFIKGFPVRYLRTHSPGEIEAHVQLKDLSRPTGVAVDIEKQGGVYRMTIVARDTPFLFASLAGALASFGMDIVKAEAYSNERNTILDTFVFSDPKRTLELNPPEIDRLRNTIQQVVLGKLEVEKLLRNRPQPPKHRKRTVETNVHFDSEACDTATLIEIIAEDRPGLLYDLSKTLSSAACNIDVVLIDTEGRKAIDVFYVAYEGKKLTPAHQSTLEKSLLAACL